MSMKIKGWWELFISDPELILDETERKRIAEAILKGHTSGDIQSDEPEEESEPIDWEHDDDEYDDAKQNGWL